MIKWSVSIFGQTTDIGFVLEIESHSDYQKFNIQCLVFNIYNYDTFSCNLSLKDMQN